MTATKVTLRDKYITAQLITLNAKASLIRSDIKLINLETKVINLKSSNKQINTQESIDMLKELKAKVIKAKKVVVANTKVFKMAKVKEKEAKLAFENSKK